MDTATGSGDLAAHARLRVQVKHSVAIGPGKADVLQGIAETGSIAEAGRRLGMSYQRAWSLVAAMNRDFVAPLVAKRRGGAAGGGAELTPTGARVLAVYRAIERDALRAVSRSLPRLAVLIRADAGAVAARAAAPAVARQRGGARRPAPRA